jgi:hypothetical protein
VEASLFFVGQIFCVCDCDIGGSMANFFQDYVNFIITDSGHKNACVERRFPRDMTIAHLKVMSYLFFPGLLFDIYACCKYFVKYRLYNLSQFSVFNLLMLVFRFP